MRKSLAVLLAVCLAFAFAASAFAAEEKEKEAVKYGSEVGSLYKPFTLKDPVEDKDYSLGDFMKTGKDTALVFMQTACSLCVAELQDILEVKDEIKAKLNVVFVSLDFDPARIKPYKEAYKIPYPVLHDRDANLLTAAKFSATPATLVIDPKGAIKKKINGYSKGEVKGFLKEYR